jgi:putative phosphoribosyl transferase
MTTGGFFRPFRNRADAGEQLGAALERHRRDGSIVLGIPRGGVEVGLLVAEALEAVFSVLVARKLPFPDNPEAGFGAVAEDGTLYFIPRYKDSLPPTQVNRIIREQEAEVLRRVKLFRPERPLPDLTGRHVILVDDGIAMGSTTLVAVACCRNKGAARVTVAAPVASPDALEAVRQAADGVEVLHAPDRFEAVAQFYDHWADLTDQDVVKLVGGFRRGAAIARWPAG